jgi:glycosyltransferase involved in cell wall biosynthesis
LKILHIIIGLKTGGAETVLKRLIEAHIDNSNYAHEVVSLTEIGKVGEQLLKRGVKVQSLGMNSAIGGFFVFWQLIRLIRKVKPDIVQTWMYHADLIGGLAARFSGVKRVIWGIRTTEIRASGSMLTVVIRKLCALFSRLIPTVIVCVAEASKQVHIALGYDAQRMVIIPNGFIVPDLNRLTEQACKLRKNCDFTEKDIVIGSVGRFNPVKDQQSFIQAAGIILNKYPNTRIMIVGRDINATNIDLIKWMNETGNIQRFTLLGERGDVDVCMKAMDVFCLHSRTEGFPNVLGEAMSVARASVTTDVGDAALLLGDCGTVVVNNDVRALMEGLEKMVRHSKEEREILGQKARLRIQQNFTLQQTVKQFENVYRKIFIGVK